MSTTAKLKHTRFCARFGMKKINELDTNQIPNWKTVEDIPPSFRPGFDDNELVEKIQQGNNRLKIILDKIEQRIRNEN